MIFIWLIVIALIILDLFNIFRFTAKFGAGLILLFAPHILLLRTHLAALGFGELNAPLTVLTAYSLLRLNLKPIKKHKTLSHRLNFLYGGKRLLNLGIYTTLMQIPLYIGYFLCNCTALSGYKLIPDAILAYVLISLMLLNGMLRIILTSRWLNIFKRLLCFWFILIPPVNIAVMLYLRHIAAKEYDYFVYKLDDMPKEIENKICQTKYPILLVHGVGFRDARYFNYWGRIPKQLRKRGAAIFYGNQEGWATIEYNAELLYNRVMEILKETGAEKINIIAHSKGGLDCRCMISTYHMDKYIASLTTMGTPHYGVKFADVLLKHIPSKIVDTVSNIINKIFYSYGDTNPDFKTAVNQLTEKFAANFNTVTPNSPDIFYQSYASVMGNPFSDCILTIPYNLGKIEAGGQNDGLVPEPSAHWGEFKGVISNKRFHGVSHGDLIDLKREDFRGFDMITKYIEIVSDLKEKGY